MTDNPDLTVVDDTLDPLGDLEAGDAQKASKNRAKVGSARPSSLLYTYGPGSVMDLPQFTVMPAGLDDWDRIWARRSDIPAIHAPRLLEVVRTFLGHDVAELRPFPWAPKTSFASKEGDDLGVPARVFPQWLRCTGCSMLAPLSRFDYVNTNPFRPDRARFEHSKCPGRSGRPGKIARPAVPARYLLACEDGHLDEFPYTWWVHRGDPCPAAPNPTLKMLERTVGKGASATIVCAACDARRPMNEAQGTSGRGKLPYCRGRHPHLNAFEAERCIKPARLMLLGASNLWFPATQSIIVMPESAGETLASRADDLRAALGEKLQKYAANLDMIRDLLDDKAPALANLPDPDLTALVALALEPPPSDEERAEILRTFDPISLLVPEWRYLQVDPLGNAQADPSGLVLSPRALHPDLDKRISRVLAVDKLRKVNAVVGFTRVDDMERANDLPARLAPLTRTKRPTWAVATEDRGEGIFIQLDEGAVARWETMVEGTALWADHEAAHTRNFERRFSETAKDVDPATRFKPPRYWLLHTFAHVLIREMAMYSGYSAASLSERIYAWPESEGRPAAAGFLIVTTASDSDGTLGGLVQLSDPDRLERVVCAALERATRCSSDPVCAHRTPKDPEDFLHGAACHTCAMASETSCERANRFLDRRFLVDLPGAVGLGFFS
ncbi:MAG: DUF1998 domain-containing protein [Cellulomonas sp.]|nr:DUF1998 domain-containing protein [Cellulomonas sp.]MCR6648532.1 DUF1998 domain-containing protein [Cellulomonas sp.]